MSIIVDSLERLQKSRHTRDAFETVAEDFDDTTDIYETEKQKPKKIRWLILIAMMAIIAFNAYQIQQEQSFTDQFTEPGQTQELSENFRQLLTVAESGESQSAEIKSVEKPVKIATENLTATLDEILPSDFELKDEVIPATELTASNATKTVNPAELSSNTVPESMSWYKDGVDAFQNNDFQNAINIWTNNFEKLPASTPLYSIMVNRVSEHVTANLNKLLAQKFTVFAVEAAYKNQRAYYTLAIIPEAEFKADSQAILKTVNANPYPTNYQFILEKIRATKDGVTPEAPALSKKAPVTTAQPKAPDMSAQLESAKTAVREGRYNDAEQYLKPLLAKNASNWEVLFWMGNTQIGLGFLNLAEVYFNKALALNAEMPQLWIQRAVIAQEKNEHYEALKFLNKARELAPKSPEIVLNVAYSNDALGDLNGAILSYQEFLDLTSSDSKYVEQRRAVNNRLNDLNR